MYKTKLIKLLRSFSKSEIRKFTFFARASYGKHESKIGKLLDEIIKHYPDFNSINFSKKQLYKKIYHDSRFNDATIRKLISYLTKLGEDFLAYQNLKRDKFTCNLFLLKELNARNMDTVFEQQSALAEKQIKKFPRNTDYYYNSYRLLNTINSYYSIRKRTVAVDNYQKETDSFFRYFFIEVLNIYMYLLNEKNISNKDFNLVLFNEVINYLGNNPQADSISVSLYYNCLMLMTTEDKEYFYMLRKISKSLDCQIYGEVQKVVFIVLYNFCAAQVKKGILKFKFEVFELIKESISNRLHISGNRIHIFSFLNFVYHAVSVGETKWAENFIKENRKQVEPQYEFDAVNLCYAWCEFSKKEFENALTHLSKINMEYSQFKLSVRTLMLMIYYELELYDSATSLLDSYRHFITRDKVLPAVDRENRINFAKYYKEILNLKTGNSKDTDSLLNNIKLTDNLIEKEWFLAKIEELKL